MRTAVYFEGRRAGSLDWRQESGGVRAVLDCELCSACILRVYAETEGAAPLYVGLPEPQGGRLRLARRLSAETLRQAGWTGKEPLRVYLAERQEQTPRVEPEKRAPRTEPPCIEPPRTGDAVYVAGMGGGYEYNNNVFGILCADGTTKAKLIMRSYGSSQIIFEFVYPAR